MPSQVFTVPKLLRPYFMHHRELLGPLCAAAWQTVRELMAMAAGEEQGLRPGMVAMSQTFGDQLNPHPHVHALVTRGGWTACGEWVGVPYLSIARIASPATIGTARASTLLTRPVNTASAGPGNAGTP